MNEFKAGADLGVPEDHPISPEGLNELKRLICSQEKPVTPHIGLASAGKGNRRGFKLLQFQDTASSEEFPGDQAIQRPAQDSRPKAAFLGRGASTSSTAYSSSVDPSFFSSTLSEEARPRTEAAPEELGLLPTTAHCNRCQKRRFTQTRMRLPTLSMWQLLCCVNDIVWCCTQSSDWQKYQRIDHKCSVCGHCIGTVEPV